MDYESTPERRLWAQVLITFMKDLEAAKRRLDYAVRTKEPNFQYHNRLLDELVHTLNHPHMFNLCTFAEVDYKVLKEKCRDILAGEFSVIEVDRRFQYLPSYLFEY